MGWIGDVERACSGTKKVVYHNDVFEVIEFEDGEHSCLLVNHLRSRDQVQLTNCKYGMEVEEFMKPEQKE